MTLFWFTQKLSELILNSYYANNMAQVKIS